MPYLSYSVIQSDIGLESLGHMTWKLLEKKSLIKQFLQNTLAIKINVLREIS